MQIEVKGSLYKNKMTEKQFQQQVCPRSNINSPINRSRDPLIARPFRLPGLTINVTTAR